MDLGYAPAQGTYALIFVTAIITSLLVGVFGKKLAESALALLLKPIKALYELAYRYIAPRNPFSIAVRSYRKHVLRSNLTRMENPVGPNLDVPLEHAFAPLKLRSSTTQESIDLFSYAASTRRCIVLGGPGTGKTTLMKSLVTSILKKRCHPDLAGSIPVFVVLRNLAKKQHSVNQAMVSALADHHFPGADRFIESALDAGKMVIILDGLDEVGASREFVVEQILSFCQYDAQRERQNRLLVTCREHSYRTMDLREGVPEIVQVEPFANHHMRVFLEGWPIHKDRSAIRLYSLIQGDSQIRDICRNPLLLTILTGLYLDVDDFQIPASRERFYQNAIDELLIHRPARRQIKQTFKEDAKRQILERVALERLETVDQLEDPEELTYDALRKMAEAVLRQDKPDIPHLITELVEVNGIIKPVSEDSFTCAHRTILEYFAAREAIRRRKTSEIIATFGGRPELIEVLYFYCGLLENLPGLESIVDSLAKQQRWLEAGQSLVHMKEAPDGRIVGEVASELRDLIMASVDIKAPLEVLSSMANRRDPEFETAGPFFHEAIDHLAASDEAGASALESAIATSPEIAFKLIPGMLKHSSERWKAAGVQLLRDIGTDEALDQLVQLLTDKDTYVRNRAGSVLAEMIKSRNQALRQRAPLLPERKDRVVWPLEPFFPGTIAIPIAEALAPRGEESESRAINCAIKALNLQQAGSTDQSLKRWRRVPLDAALQHHRRRAGLLITSCGLLWGAAMMVSFLTLQALAYQGNRTILIRAIAPHITQVDGRFIEQLSEKAGIIVQKIETSYPSNAPWWRRVFLWNDPAIPESKIDAFRTVKRWKSMGFKISELPANKYMVPQLEGLASAASLRDMQLTIVLFRLRLGTLTKGTLFCFNPRRPSMEWVALVLVPFTMFFILIIPLPFPGFRLSKRKEIMWRSYVLAFRPGTKLRNALVASLALSYAIFVMAAGPAFAAAQSVAIFLKISLVAAICPQVGLVLARLRWPNNPLLAAVDEVMPHESSMRLSEEA